ncbi:MAG: peptidase M14 [Phycisphaeraceae bacterium]|nr:MAG: peptidase M14 [Phycisphaeraceae bacterium]
MNTFFNRSNLFIAGALLLTAVFAPRAALAQQQIDSRVDIAWNRYYDFEECEQIMRRLADAYPELLTLKSIGKSEQGRDMWLMILNNPETGPHEDKPAMWIDGSIHANEIQSTETTLYSIWYLASAYGQVKPLTELVDRVAFYFLPIVNPDGRAAWFEGPATPHMFRSGLRPTDLDFDGRKDEDGPDDLTETGSINIMWRPDPHGTHRRNPKDPRIFERVGPDETGDWSFAGWEGVDRDGDGRRNEDGPGGYDMNRNWPSDWQPNHVQRGAGDYPFSYPETRAVGMFILDHPNIAAGQAYHNTGGMLLRGPGAAYNEAIYPRSDIQVYDKLGKAGEEMLPHYNYWVIHADLYTVHGGFVNWLAEGLGIISFTNELWTDRRILQSGQNPTAEQRMRWQDRVLFGQTFDDWQEYDHPELGPVLIGGGTKFSSRTPPPFMLEEECHRNFAFTVFHAMNMPEISFGWTEVKRAGAPGNAEGSDLWRITLEIDNKRIIPTRTGIAAQRGIGTPDRLTLSGEGVEVVAAGTLGHRFDRTMTPTQQSPHRPHIVLSEDGVPGEGRRTYRFFVRAAEGAELTLRYTAEKARDIETTIRIEEGVIESAEF